MILTAEGRSTVCVLIGTGQQRGGASTAQKTEDTRALHFSFPSLSVCAPSAFQARVPLSCSSLSAVAPHLLSLPPAYFPWEPDSLLFRTLQHVVTHVLLPNPLLRALLPAGSSSWMCGDPNSACSHMNFSLPASPLTSLHTLVLTSFPRQ